MTDGTRILRTLAIPLVPALVLLILVPRSCSKALNAKKLRATTATQAPTDTALHIESVSPDAPPTRSIDWPAGFDAPRAQYLIEVDPHFTEPVAARIPKEGGGIVDSEAAEAFTRNGWFERNGMGYMPATGASLHLAGMTEEATAWRVPLGTRKFGRVTVVRDLGDGRAALGFSWQWEPNEAGRALKGSAYELHEGRAEFAGGGEHPWTLTQLSVDSEWR